MDQDCIFCKVANKEMVSHGIYENDKFYAFLDINPLSEGHTIIIPKIHCENFLHMPKDYADMLCQSIREVSEILEKKLNADGLTIGINHRPAAGQAVPHMHVHVIPRFVGDGGGSLHSVINNSPKIDIEEVCKKISS